MSELPPCPKCQSPYMYEDRGLHICPECGHECSAQRNEEGERSTTKIVRDAQPKAGRVSRSPPGFLCDAS